MKLTLVLISFFVLSELSYAQSSDDEKQIKVIRDHYYGLSKELNGLTKYIVNDTLSAYKKGGNIEKIVMDGKANQSVEYYFNSKKELLFIFSIKNKQENRYYFTVGNSNSFKLTYPRMIRWINEKGQQVKKDNKLYSSTGLKQSENATKALYLSNLIINASDEVKKGWKRANIINFQVELIEQEAELVNEVDNLEPETEEDLADGEPANACWDLTKNYSGQANDNIVKSKNESGCDAGCTVTSKEESVTYFSTNKDIILKTSSSFTQYYGYSNMVYDNNSASLFSTTYQYFFKNELVFTRTESGINSYILSIE